MIDVLNITKQRYCPGTLFSANFPFEEKKICLVIGWYEVTDSSNVIEHKVSVLCYDNSITNFDWKVFVENSYQTDVGRMISRVITMTRL